MIGMVVNSVVLVGDLRGEPTFRELLARTQRLLLEAHAFQDLPFEKLVEALRPERDPAYNPLFQVMFSFHDSPVPELAFAGLTGAIEPVHNGSAKLDWNVNDQNTATIRYNYLDASRDLPPHPFVLSAFNSGRGPNQTSLPFYKSGYQINNNLHSIAAELNSRWTGYANRFFASYNRFRDFRKPFSEDFPTIEIAARIRSLNRAATAKVMCPPYEPPVTTTRFASRSGRVAIQSNRVPTSRYASSRRTPLSSWRNVFP